MEEKKGKKKLIGLLVATNLMTFTFASVTQFSFMGRTTIPKDEYEILKSSFEDNTKLMALESYVEDNFLWDVDKTKLKDGELKGMLQSLNDPYSEYKTIEEFKALTEETSGEYSGIGVVVSPSIDNYITVVAPIEGSPGEKAGIKSGDKILKVDGVEFFSNTMDEAVKHMKGEENTEVKLTILRDGRESEIPVKREKIRLETVKAEMMNDGFGYIRITSFDKLTQKDFKAGLEDLSKQDLKGIVIDLRGNPGGLLDVTAEIADMLLGEGDIVYTQTKNGEREYLKSDKKMINYPLTVLVDGGSASASEILSGAIKDHERGKIIGTQTFGKGIVQQVRELNDGSGFKLTVSEYFTPNGINIHGVGIEPDIVIELPEDIKGIGPSFISEDTQLQKAVEVLKEEIK